MQGLRIRGERPDPKREGAIRCSAEGEDRDLLCDLVGFERRLQHLQQESPQCLPLPMAHVDALARDGFSDDVDLMGDANRRGPEDRSRVLEGPCTGRKSVLRGFLFFQAFCFWVWISVLRALGFFGFCVLGGGGTYNWACCGNSEHVEGGGFVHAYNKEWGASFQCSCVEVSAGGDVSCLGLSVAGADHWRVCTCSSY